MTWTQLGEYRIGPRRNISVGSTVDVRTRYRLYTNVWISEIRINERGDVEICSFHKNGWRCFRASDIETIHRKVPERRDK